MVVKEVDKIINESILQWFSHIERMENNMISKKVYVGSYLIGQIKKRWIDSVNDYLKKRGLMLGKQEGWCMIVMNGDNLQGDESPDIDEMLQLWVATDI